MRYRAIILGQEGRPEVPDLYEDEGHAVLLCPKSRRLLLQVSNQAIYYQLGTMQQGVGGLGAVIWQHEEPWLPVTASFGRDFDAVRVRNFTAGAGALAVKERTQVLLSVA